MISNLDIWRAAILLIRQHAENAELEAARLAGSGAGALRWRLKG